MRNKDKIKTDFDILIVGGGPAGVSAASVIVKKGLKVAIIDGGNIISDNVKFSDDFETLRHTNKDQYKLFLGEDLSGVNLETKSHASSQVSGTKKHVLKDTEFLPIEAQNIDVLQTLAKGGFTEIWGANCDFFSKEELGSVSIPPEEMERYYQEVINEIGVCGVKGKYKLQPPAKIDHNARKLLNTYQNKLDSFKKLNLEIHKPFLALLTKNKQDRRATKYRDMEYWSDLEKSVYRARYSIENLEKKKNFYYIKGIADSVKESEDYVEVIVGKKGYTARRVIFAAGALNTSRILIKSFNLYNIRFPFLTKYHIISACLLLSNIGKRGDIKKHSLCQLVMTGQKNDLSGYTYTQFYSYKSLLLYKLLQYSKLPVSETMALLSLLSSCLVLADTRMGNGSGEQGYCVLEKNKTDKDIFKVVFKKPAEKSILNSPSFKKVKKGFTNLGLLQLKHTFMPYGSTVHYSGILGNTGNMNKYLKVNMDGKLERSDRLYIADASAWNALPAKPPTLTVMANSRRITLKLLQQLDRE